jgi:hypothetical protein
MPIARSRSVPTMPFSAQTGQNFAAVTATVAATRDSATCYFDVCADAASLVLVVSYIDGASLATSVYLVRLAAAGGAVSLGASTAPAHQHKVMHVDIRGRGAIVAVCMSPPALDGPSSSSCSDCALVATADGAVTIFSVNTGELLAVKQDSHIDAAVGGALDAPRTAGMLQWCSDN